MNSPIPCTTEPVRAGERMHALARELFGEHRAITGDGLRRTLRRIGEEIALEVHEVPSGTRVLDFEVPLEWSIRDAYIADARGMRVVDYRNSNLHVVSYSQGVQASMTWRELDAHLHSLPEHPDWVPYRTAFFQESWGFCLAHRERQRLAARGLDEVYHVQIDARHFPGSLTYGECFLPGETGEEVLFSAHTCHPSLANDNLSGIVVAIALASELARMPARRFGYRFVFAPATIGALAWLNDNAARMGQVRHGLVLAQLGDPAPFTYKRSRRGSATIDHAMLHVLRERQQPFEVRDFVPWGYDERQYGSPGFDLPMGRLTRSADGEYPEYHTSADNLDLITPEALADSLDACLGLIRVLEADVTYVRTNPYGEPRLGPRGLYAGYAQSGVDPELQRAVLWVLNLADGRHGLIDMAARSGIERTRLHDAAQLLVKHGLLKNCRHALAWRQNSIT